LSEHDFSGKTIVPFARMAEAVWDEVLRLFQNFARNQLFWMVWHFGEEMQKPHKTRYLSGCEKLKSLNEKVDGL